MTKKEEILVEEGSRQAPEKYYIKITPDGPYLVYGNPPIDQEIILPNEEGSSWVYQRGLSFDSSYADTPKGWLLDSRAYCAFTLSLDLHTSKPSVGASCSVFS